MDSNVAILTLVLWLIIVAIVIFINYRAAKKFERIAADKGYVNEHVFAWCFWLPAIGYFMVMAMPKKN